MTPYLGATYMKRPCSGTKSCVRSPLSSVSSSCCRAFNTWLSVMGSYLGM